MEHIASTLANTLRNIEIVGADPVTRHGFTQVPNFILTEPKLSVGAKLTYAMLLSYAWHIRDHPGARAAITWGHNPISSARFKNL